MRLGRPTEGLGVGPTGAFAAARLVGLAAGLVAVLLSARLFGPDGRGVIAAFAVLQFLGATGLALGSGSGAFVAAHRDTETGPAIANGLLAIAAGLGVVAAALAGAAWFLGAWHVAIPGTPLVVALALGPAVAGQYLVLGGSQLALGAGATKRAAAGLVIGPAVMLLSVGAAAVAGLSLPDFLLVQAAAWLLAGAIFVIAGGGRLPGLSSARRILTGGRGAALGDLTNALSYRVDVLLVAALAGSAATGVYSLATQLMEPLWLLATSTASGLLIGFRGRSERERAARTVRAGRQTAALTAAGAVALVLAVPVASALAGPGFEDAPRIGLLLAPGIVFLAIAKIFAAYQTSLGRLWLGSVIATVAVAVGVAGGLLLIPPFGAAGAALAASLSYGSALAMWLVAFRGVRVDVGAEPADDEPRPAAL